jgi:hypothetical protein
MLFSHVCYSFFRPSFEVVKEGRILKKIKQLLMQNVSVSCLVPSFRPKYIEWKSLKEDNQRPDLT